MIFRFQLDADRGDAVVADFAHHQLDWSDPQAVADHRPVPQAPAHIGADRIVAVLVVDRRAVEDAELTGQGRSEEHTSELQSLMRNSSAVVCLKKKKKLI